MGKPQSERTRKTNEKCHLAIITLTKDEFPNIHVASQHFNVPFKTLQSWVHGGQTHVECREELQLLSPAEEKVLVSLITHFMASGHPLSHPQLQEMAEEIRKQ